MPTRDLVAVALTILCSLLVARTAYFLALSQWGWRVPDPARPGARTRRFVVVIPARDEEAVIARVVDDMLNQDYSPSLVSVWVIADRCTDGTADAAVRAGASVFRLEREVGGKGVALDRFLESHPLGPDSALVVMDADNRAAPTLLQRFADEIDAGASVLQAYVDVSNPNDSAVATASALSYWSAARTVQNARRVAGLSAQLNGTGMCITAAALSQAGGFVPSMTEDRDLELRLIERGFRVVWLHDVRVSDEKPRSLDVLSRQRARWASGVRSARSAHRGPLAAKAVRGSWQALDTLLELHFPSRTMSMAMLAGLLAVSLAVGISGWVIAAGATVFAGTVVTVVASLFAEGVRPAQILRLPLLAVFVIVWVPVQVLSRSTRTGWFKTPHTGSEAGSDLRAVSHQ